VTMTTTTTTMVDQVPLAPQISDRLSGGGREGSVRSVSQSQSVLWQIMLLYLI